MTITLEKIYEYYSNPQLTFLCCEQAICYVLSSTLQKDSYGTELIAALNSTKYRLSDTVLHEALSFLLEEGTIQFYWQKVDGRGRPRKMFTIATSQQDRARDLAKYWERVSA